MQEKLNTFWRANKGNKEAIKAQIEQLNKEWEQKRKKSTLVTWMRDYKKPDSPSDPPKGIKNLTFMQKRVENFASILLYLFFSH